MDIDTRMHCQKVRMVCVHNAFIFIFLRFSFFLTVQVFFFLCRGSSLLLGPKPVWTTWAGNAWIQHIHTSDHTIFAGHSFCPAISRWRSQFCYHSLRGCVWLGEEQVWSAWPERHQGWVFSSLKRLNALKPWTLN